MDDENRMQIEGDLQARIELGLSSEPDTVKEFRKTTARWQKPLEDQYELAMVMLLIQFAEQYQDSPLGEELAKRNSELDRLIRRRAQVLANRQMKKLDRRLQKTNRRIVKEEEEQSLEDDSILASRLWGKNRAEAIAITETTTAINIGEHEAVQIAKQQFGMDAYAVWFTAEDERVCPRCLPFHGTKEDVWGDEFPYGGPVHVRCRCSLVWYVK
jgi:hypothetical protein